jgi:exodeoxyribonuclease VIII
MSIADLDDIGITMQDVMLDLETMGNGPRSAIVAIGAVRFDIARNHIGDRFYAAVDLASSVAMGGEMDPSTVLWWMRQSDSARSAFERPGALLSAALMQFTAWLHDCGSPNDVRVWGNGAAFDNVILASAYRCGNMPLPWRYWNDRCYRTIRAQHPGVKLERVGVHHNAADDAESQARHLLAMLNGSTVLARLED